MQQIRISTLSRIRDVIRKKREGIEFNEVEVKKEDGEKEKGDSYTDDELLELLREEIKKGNLDEKEFKYLERCLTIAKETLKVEAKYKLAMEDYVNTELIYTEFLSKIRGIGIVLSTNILKEFGDCSNYATISKLWEHCGQGVDGNDKAPRRRKGEEINYSPRLKTLAWKISDCLMKSNNGIYRRLYVTGKEGNLNLTFQKGELFAKYGKPYTEEDTKLKLIHAHNRALRKMRKVFLSHLWVASRELNNNMPLLEQHYAVKVLHHDAGNIISWRKAIEMERGKDKKVKPEEQ
jgi:hypothetical protein